MKEEDWLSDPLASINYECKFTQPKGGYDPDGLWKDYHFCTRLKLDAADHFCRQLLGMAQLPHDFGLPLLAHRKFKWSLDIFFFELMSAYDMVLQEINALYGMNLEPEKVTWGRIKKKKDKMTEGLFDYMSKEQDLDWFKKVRDYRNTAAHRSYIWARSSWASLGDNKPWNRDLDSHEVTLAYFNTKTQTVESEEIGVCREHLQHMVKHIHEIWSYMAREF